MNTFDLLKYFPVICRDINLIDQLYRRIDLKTGLFASDYAIKCPQGCGSCCSIYEPDIYYSEALFAAFWIIKENKSLSSLFQNIENRKNCIFYDDKNDYHCLIYPARPLLCRAFAFSGVLDKYGNHKYKSCKFMDERKEFSGNFVPLMTNEGNTILYNNDMENPLPLSVAVEKAWQKISFIMNSAAMENTNTDISRKYIPDCDIAPDDRHPPDTAPQPAA